MPWAKTLNIAGLQGPIGAMGPAGVLGAVGPQGAAGVTGYSDFRVQDGIPQCYVSELGVWVNLGIEPAVPAFGAPLAGGFFAGLISHSADGNPTHALIVAPRNGGASGGSNTGGDCYPIPTNLWFRDAGTATGGAGSQFDGAANTAWLAAVGGHPAASFCSNLIINGYDDWYLPARYELEIAYHGLKPTADLNAAEAAWGDGINPYSVPRRDVIDTPYVPAQTTNPLFQLGGGEHFFPFVHWVSTEYSGRDAWILTMDNMKASWMPKIFESPVRAFRKIPYQEL